MTTILIVDDYAVTQRVLGHILKQGGYQTLNALNGLDALEILAEAPVDLMICDIAMPEMDGLTLLSELRKDQHYAHLPIVMLTASGQDEDRMMAEAMGADGFLTKPASSSELLEVVQRFLG